MLEFSGFSQDHPQIAPLACQIRICLQLAVSRESTDLQGFSPVPRYYRILPDIPVSGDKVQPSAQGRKVPQQRTGPIVVAKKKGNPPAAKMQPAGLDLYPLPQGRLHKSTSNELWQDHGDHIVAVDGSVRQFSGGWQSVTSSVCRW